LELGSFRNKVAFVLFQLPGAEGESSGRELAGWSERLPDFGRLRVQIIGVLPESPATLRRLVRDEHLAVTLLSDESGEIRRSYAPDAGTGEGVATTVVDRSGRVVGVVARTARAQHADEVLADVQRLKLEHPGALDPI
jgi:peroxiredoxin